MLRGSRTASGPPRKAESGSSKCRDEPARADSRLPKREQTPPVERILARNVENAIVNSTFHWRIVGLVLFTKRVCMQTHLWTFLLGFAFPLALGAAPPPTALTLIKSNNVKTVVWPRPSIPAWATNTLLISSNLSDFVDAPAGSVAVSIPGYTYSTTNTLATAVLWSAFITNEQQCPACRQRA